MIDPFGSLDSVDAPDAASRCAALRVFMQSLRRFSSGKKFV